MNNSILVLLIVCVFSCGEFSPKSDASLSAVDTQTDTLNTIEEKKLEALYHAIISQRIKKYQGENSSKIYYSVKEYHQKIDTLIAKYVSAMDNLPKQKELLETYETIQADLISKWNSSMSEVLGATSNAQPLSVSSIDFDQWTTLGIAMELRNSKIEVTQKAQSLLEHIKTIVEEEKGQN